MTVALNHVPVLLNEVVDGLQPQTDGVYLDCTLGRGGHSEAILQAAECTVIGLDRDPEAIAQTRDRLKHFGERFVSVQSPFSQFRRVLDGLGIERIDGLLAELGVSSPQLDDPSRGFSFQRSGPLDMRMDPESPLNAAEIVNEWAAEDIANAIYQYGEERQSRAIARLIVAGRPWTDTVQLAEAIATRFPQRKAKIHPATRTFQGLRIAVNRELTEIEELLPSALESLSSGGRLAVISFHSLEDRIVKRFFALESGRTGARDAYGNPVVPPRIHKPHPLIKPTKEDPNPRARSARLRIAERLPWTH